jgi:hypothetical protein
MSLNPPEPPVEMARKCQNGARAQGFAAPRKTSAPLRSPRRSDRMVLRRAAPAG